MSNLNKTESMSARDYFSISPAIMGEHFIRLWPISVLAFLVYFFAGIFPILLSWNSPLQAYHHIQMCLSGTNPFFTFAVIFFPVLVAIMTGRSTHISGHVSVLHAMPLNRAMLFRSNTLAGFIILVVPVLLTTLLFGIIVAVFPESGLTSSMSSGVSRAGAIIGGSGSFSMFEETGVLSTGLGILYWVCYTVIAIGFIYGLSCLAGAVSGNTPMHLFLAVLLNAFAPALFGILLVYCYAFFTGFKAAVSSGTLLFALSPVLFPFNYHDGPWIVPLIVYTLIAILANELSTFIYTKRPPERVSDSLCFNWAKVTANWIIAFLGMTLTACYFYFIENDILYLFIGAAVGGVVFYAIGAIITGKTFQIFSQANLRSFAVYALCSVLFFCSMQYDFFGFETKIPKDSQVETAHVSSHFDQQKGIGIATPNLAYKSEDTLAAITALHKEITEKLSSLEDSNENSYWFSFYYDLGTWLPMERQYDLSYSFLKGSPAYRTLIETAEYKEIRDPAKLDISSINTVMLYPGNMGTYHENSSFPLSMKANEYKEFLAALSADIHSETFDEYMDRALYFASVKITYDTKIDRYGHFDFEIGITRHYENTIAWLTDYGYYDKLALTPEKVLSASVTISGESSIINVDTIITDKELLGEIIKHGERFALNENDHVRIDLNERFSRGESGGEISDTAEFPTDSIYLNPGNPVLEMDAWKAYTGN